MRPPFAASHARARAQLDKVVEEVKAVAGRIDVADPMRGYLNIVGSGPLVGCPSIPTLCAGTPVAQTAHQRPAIAADVRYVGVLVPQILLKCRSGTSSEEDAYSDYQQDDTKPPVTLPALARLHGRVIRAQAVIHRCACQWDDLMRRVSSLQDEIDNADNPQRTLVGGSGTACRGLLSRYSPTANWYWRIKVGDWRTPSATPNVTGTSPAPPVFSSRPPRPTSVGTAGPQAQHIAAGRRTAVAAGRLHGGFAASPCRRRSARPCFSWLRWQARSFPCCSCGAK